MHLNGCTVSLLAEDLEPTTASELSGKVWKSSRNFQTNSSFLSLTIIQPHVPTLI